MQKLQYTKNDLHFFEQNVLKVLQQSLKKELNIKSHLNEKGLAWYFEGKVFSVAINVNPFDEEVKYLLEYSDGISADSEYNYCDITSFANRIIMLVENV